MRAIWSVRPKCSHRLIDRLSDANLFKTCASPQAQNQKLSRANRYENEMVKTYRDLNCSGASPKRRPAVRGHVKNVTNGQKVSRQSLTIFMEGQSTVGGPKWTKMDLFRPKRTKWDHFGPFWSRECWNRVRNKVILTKMVVWTILVQYTFRQYRGHSPNFHTQVNNLQKCVTFLF